MPIDREMQPHFRDVTDHVRRVSEEIDALREVLAFAFEASLMAGQAQHTVTTRRLAAWAASGRTHRHWRNLRDEFRAHARAQVGLWLVTS